MLQHPALFSDILFRQKKVILPECKNRAKRFFAHFGKFRGVQKTAPLHSALFLHSGFMTKYKNKPPVCQTGKFSDRIIQMKNSFKSVLFMIRFRISSRGQGKIYPLTPNP